MIERTIPLKILRNTQERTYLKFVIGNITRLTGDAAVLARSIGSHAHPQECEARADQPAPRDLPSGKNLCAVRASMRMVRGSLGKHFVRGQWARREERGAGLIGLQVVVEVQEGRQIEGQLFGYLGAIPKLIGKQFLGFAIGSASDLDHSKVTAIERDDSYVDPNGGVCPSWLPDGPRRGDPESMASSGVP